MGNHPQIPLYCLNITLAGLLLSCGGEPPKASIKIDGSSTVYPITQAVVDAYKNEKGGDTDITLRVSGTSGGFREFCEGKTDISNASRPIHNNEMAMCNRYNTRYLELPIAFDAITVVVNPKNTWANSLTTEELKTMWQTSAEGKIKNWQQIRSNFPNLPLNLYGPGTDSGTFDYFTEAIVGKEGDSRLDYVKTEDDLIIVQAVKQDVNGLGYLGIAYYEKNADGLRAVAIDDRGKGAVLPSRENVEKAQYHPLSRPLFIYVNLQASQSNPALKEFVEFYLKKAPKVVTDVGYVPLPEEGYHLAKVTFYNGEAGTVFDGKSQIDITIAELLRKKAKF